MRLQRHSCPQPEAHSHLEMTRTLLLNIMELFYWVLSCFGCDGTVIQFKKKKVLFCVWLPGSHKINKNKFTYGFLFYIWHNKSYCNTVNTFSGCESEGSWSRETTCASWQRCGALALYWQCCRCGRTSWFMTECRDLGGLLSLGQRLLRLLKRVWSKYRWNHLQPSRVDLQSLIQLH